MDQFILVGVKTPTMPQLVKVQNVIGSLYLKPFCYYNITGVNENKLDPLESVVGHMFRNMTSKREINSQTDINSLTHHS